MANCKALAGSALKGLTRLQTQTDAITTSNLLLGIEVSFKNANAF